MSTGASAFVSNVYLCLHTLKIMKHTFFLAHPDKEVSAILICLRDGSKRKTISTGINIRTTSWDKENKTIIKKSEDGVYLGRLAKLDVDILKIAKTVDASEGGLTDFYDEVMLLVGKKKVKEDTSKQLLPFYRYWSANSFGKHKADRHTKFVFERMQEFLVAKDLQKITFEEVDYIFFMEFLKWMEEDKEYKKNTQGEHVKLLKAVMNEAMKRGLHSNTDFKHFEKPVEKIESVYLSLQEYDLLYNLELEGTEAKARDLFLIGCYTALRVSDYSRLTPNDIKDGFIYIEQKKTKKRVVIPAHARVKEIIKKYNGSPQLCEPTLNEYIKKVCRKAGITEKVNVRTKDGYEYKEKCDLVTTHTARRSAATNMALNGTPLRDIMQITGHTLESSLLRYIKISDEQNARRLASNPFFL